VELPLHSREAVEQELQTLDFLEEQIESVEKRLEAIMKVRVEADLLNTLPCVGKILSMVLMLEIGKVDRFPTQEHLASYAGLVPRVRSSGGHTRMGQVCGNVNRNLKWAFVEAGNLIVISQQRLAGTHVVRLYQRIKRRKNHQKAVVAVARHLTEAAWWVLTKLEGSLGRLSRASTVLWPPPTPCPASVPRFLPYQAELPPPDPAGSLRLT